MNCCGVPGSDGGLPTRRRLTTKLTTCPTRAKLTRMERMRQIRASWVRPNSRSTSQGPSQFGESTIRRWRLWRAAHPAFNFGFPAGDVIDLHRDYLAGFHGRADDSLRWAFPRQISQRQALVIERLDVTADGIDIQTVDGNPCGDGVLRDHVGQRTRTLRNGEDGVVLVMPKHRQHAVEFMRMGDRMVELALFSPGTLTA